MLNSTHVRRPYIANVFRCSNYEQQKTNSEQTYSKCINEKHLLPQKSSLDGKGSAFLHVPLARVGIVGQIAEFEWEYQYDTSVANGGDVKIVQFSKRSNLQTKPRILWKFQDNVKTTIPEYAERLFVSNVTRNEREKYPIERYTFKLFKVNTNDEGYYELNVGFTNEEMDLDSRVSLDVHGKDIN